MMRDIPGQAGTSKLSPHAHFGEISPRFVWHKAKAAGDGKGVQTFLKELLWREFSINLLWQHPDIRTKPIREEFADFPWAEQPGHLQAWRRGRTGIPIVDAGMRELWQTGWMHNRVRMICASYLVKHLLIPWQAGEAWSWDTLCEADEAANGASWQWVADSGKPERLLRWVGDIPAEMTAYVGHDQRLPNGRPYVRHSRKGGTAIFLDTGAGKGGHLLWMDIDPIS